MQTIYVMKTDKDTGEKKQVAKQVIRSWIDATGKSVFLFAGEGYLSREGTPFRSLEDLDILKSYIPDGKDRNGDPKQKEIPSVEYEQAKRWWIAEGKAMSEAYYEEKAEATRKLYEQGVPVQPEGGDSELEKVKYTRQKDTNRGTAGVSIPRHYGDWFPKRPDWWGQAELIVMNGYRYRIEKEPDVKAAVNE